MRKRLHKRDKRYKVYVLCKCIQPDSNTVQGKADNSDRLNSNQGQENAYSQR